MRGSWRNEEAPRDKLNARKNWPAKQVLPRGGRGGGGELDTDKITV